MVLSISELPPEVLAQILDGPLSFAAVEFWKTGDSVLRSKLTRKGIRHVDLRHSRPKSSAIWPKCLKEFQLLSLRLVNRNGSIRDLLTVYTELRQLKSGLEHLELRFWDAGMVFFYDGLKLDPSVLTPSKRLILAEFEKANAGLDSSSHNAVPFSEAQTSLRHLILDEVENAGSILHDGLFSLLPPSLTHVNLRGMRIGRPLHNFSNLPAGITQLILPLRAINVSNIRALPSRLTNVGFGFSHDALALLNEEPNILPNLLQFPHDGTFSSFEDSTIIVRGKKKQWPSNLTALSFVGDAAQGFFDSLPVRLTELNLVTSNVVVSPNWIENVLPQSLAALHVGSIPWKDITPTLRWPSNMAHLSFTISSERSEDIYHCLPRTLKTLSLSSRPCDDVSLDQNAIDSLLIRGQRIIDQFENQRWSSLQTELLLQNNHGTWRDWCPAYIAQVSRGALLGLPLGMTTIHLSSLITHHTMGLLIPPCVTKLHLSDTRVWKTSTFFELLPPSLTSLSLADNIGEAKDLDVKQWSLTNVQSPSNSALYNSKLEELSIHFTRLQNIHLLFPLFPIALKSLSLRGAIDMKGLQCLPPNLKSLTLNSPSLPNEQWVQYLPRSLETLEVPDRRTQLFGDDVLALPPTLTHIGVVIAHMSLDQLLSLPRALGSLQCPLILPGNAKCLSRAQFEAIVHEFIPLWRIKHVPQSEVEARLALVK